ncbi:Vacuolar protein-sorting-associated protein 24 [Thecaphora frezii]
MQAVSRFIFGPTQEERVKAVQSQLRSEQRALDREMRQIEQGSNKTKMEIKKLAKKGDIKNAKVLAREVVRAAKQKDRLALSKARLNSINMQLQHQLAMYKVTGSMSKSTEIMKLSNQLVKLPEVSKVMREMSMEMTKAGIMEEMLEDTLVSGVLGEDEDEMEEEAQEEVDKVLFELTDGGSLYARFFFQKRTAPDPHSSFVSLSLILSFPWPNVSLFCNRKTGSGEHHRPSPGSGCGRTAEQRRGREERHAAHARRPRRSPPRLIRQPAFLLSPFFSYGSTAPQLSSRRMPYLAAISCVESRHSTDYVYTENLLRTFRCTLYQSSCRV